MVSLKVQEFVRLLTFSALIWSLPSTYYHFSPLYGQGKKGGE